jgi:hypothetical protein
MISKELDLLQMAGISNSEFTPDAAGLAVGGYERGRVITA